MACGLVNATMPWAGVRDGFITVSQEAVAPSVNPPAQVPELVPGGGLELHLLGALCPPSQGCPHIPHMLGVPVWSPAQYLGSLLASGVLELDLGFLVPGFPPWPSAALVCRGSVRKSRRPELSFRVGPRVSRGETLCR